MLFCPQERLAKAELAGNRSQRHSHLRAHAPSAMIPNLLLQKMAAQASGECEFNRVRFPEPFRVQGPHHRVDEVSQQQSIELMPSVERSDQIEIVPIHGSKKMVDPVWCDVCRFRRDDCTCFSTN